MSRDLKSEWVWSTIATRVPCGLKVCRWEIGKVFDAVVEHYISGSRTFVLHFPFKCHIQSWQNFCMAFLNYLGFLMWNVNDKSWKLVWCNSSRSFPVFDVLLPFTGKHLWNFTRLLCPSCSSWFSASFGFWRTLNSYSPSDVWKILIVNVQSVFMSDIGPLNMGYPPWGQCICI